MNSRDRFVILAHNEPERESWWYKRAWYSNPVCFPTRAKAEELITVLTLKEPSGSMTCYTVYELSTGNK